MKKVLWLFLVPLMSFGQAVYTVSKTTTLAGTTEVITVQQPATSGKIVRFTSAYMDSVGACQVTVERNGTPATVTTLTPIAASPSSPAPTTNGFSGSDAGVGSIITRLNIPANGSAIVSLTGVMFNQGGTGNNLTVRYASCTGVVNIVITYTESTT